MLRKIILLLVMGVIIVVMSGCSASGTHFTTFEKATDGEAIVYFYRPDKSVIGYLEPITIFEIVPEFKKRKRIGKLRNNSFFKYKCKAGKHKFSNNIITLLKSPIEVNLKQNDYICIKAERGFIQDNIYQVDKETCKKEIKKTLEMTKEDLEGVM